MFRFLLHTFRSAQHPPLFGPACSFPSPLRPPPPLVIGLPQFVRLLKRFQCGRKQRAEKANRPRGAEEKLKQEQEQGQKEQDEEQQVEEEKVKNGARGGRCGIGGTGEEGEGKRGLRNFAMKASVKLCRYSLLYRTYI